VCINKADSAGQLHLVEPKGYCRNFQPKNRGRTKRPLPDTNGAKLIPLTQRKFAIADADDYQRLAKHKWHCRKAKNNFYAFRRKDRNKVAMHREILKAPKGMVVDHIDGNGLNNRKSNLRLCTASQNARNRRPNRVSSSKYKGVSLHKRDKKWDVQIICNGKRTRIGRFDNEIEAALAYDRKAEELFGEFAYLNFPELATKARRHKEKSDTD